MVSFNSFIHPISLLFITSWLLWSRLAKAATAAGLDNSTKKKDDCLHRCGSIEIPYPFGMGPPSGCYYNDAFAVTCKKSSSNSSSRFIPVLKQLNLEILRVVLLSPYRFRYIIVKTPSATACAPINSNNNNGRGSAVEVRWSSVNLTMSPFYLDSRDNVFASVGCDGYAILYNETGGIKAGCSSVCGAPVVHLNDGLCYGYGCCQTQSDGLSFDWYSISVSVNNGSGNCRSAFLVESDYLRTNYRTFLPGMEVPLILRWSLLAYPSKGWLLDIFLDFRLPGLGILFTGLCFWLCWRHKTKKRRKEIKLRAKYFKQRLLEEQRIVSNKEAVDKIKLFTIKELMGATDNFSKDRILGQGGQGTVYKGMLTNGQVIAVKMSRKFDESQWKQFISEVILLSQIKHRHVVKLLGCCLGMKVPLVIYEFMPNGTLSEHIHPSNTHHQFLLAWDMRLRIASEAAGAIAYMHSSSSAPIYHRDIKSSNILLDDKYRAKVSDFGISKEVSMDQTHLTTLVQGTFGYLDPEYFISSHFSEKSDVYSFGVVLVELLTGQKPIRSVASQLDEDEEDEEKSLVWYFMSSMNKSNLYDIIDPMVRDDCEQEDILVVANLAKQCLNPRGHERPTMKEVAMVLEGLRRQSSLFPMLVTLHNRVIDDHQEIESHTTTSVEILDDSNLSIATFDVAYINDNFHPMDVEQRLLRTT